MGKNIWIKNKNNKEYISKFKVSPYILSASRVTDIPAFYTKWFFDNFNNGYFKWINPFNNKEQLVYTSNVRLIVFWSKHPEPIIPYLKILDEKGINYYIQYTLNDYEKENLEPDLPKLEKRIEIFKSLSCKIGKEKVIWRFDPLVLLPVENKIGENYFSYIDILIEKIYNIGQELIDYTDKLVISFVDILQYRKVQRKFKKYFQKFYDSKNDGKNKNEYFDFEFNDDRKIEFAKKLDEVRKAFINKNKNFKIATCCEDIDLSKYNIEHNKCIDDELIKKIFFNDKILIDFLSSGRNLKDSGQRKYCGCIVSKDIGLYSSCKFNCVYCYSNR